MNKKQLIVVGCMLVAAVFIISSSYIGSIDRRTFISWDSLFVGICIVMIVGGLIIRALADKKEN